MDACPYGGADIRRCCGARGGGPAAGPAVTGLPTTPDPRVQLERQRAGRAEFNRVMPRRAVQALLLDIARAPRERAYVDAALHGTDVTAERLEAIGLVREPARPIAWRFPC